ncbi:MAG: nucleoside 2-deoxyribosyltransferase [Candidatus Aenigmatarchaeota archaeon]|nr:nucleoside 2-deoxyribosyltransferase [Candidatus Aenigmarchaeota archaeon]
MRIYFAGAIRGGREYQEIYRKIISHLKIYGNVLTEHVSDKNITDLGEYSIPDNEIYERDMKLLEEADLLVAEVSLPSLGVGYEIGIAEGMNKKIICLYDKNSEKRLSAMIAGNPKIKLIVYENLDELKRKIDEILEKMNSRK